MVVQNVIWEVLILDSNVNLSVSLKVTTLTLLMNCSMQCPVYISVNKIEVLHSACFSVTIAKW